MSKILYIQSSPRQERSKSIQTADAFLKAYQKLHPADSVETMNLFEADLPRFDGPAAEARYTILHGQNPAAQHRQIWAQIEKVIGHFTQADKYLLAVPMWNFSIPWRLKQYLDLLIQPTYTFRVGENGYEGLVKDKPIMVVYARGSAYPADSPAAAIDFQKKYLEWALSFIGFQKIGSIVVEPTLGDAAARENALKKAMEEAQKAAETF
ncbi:MAG TPA: NAD(P)H-dependent oxidoreductase [Anaerohalosphaeraceae bacterium]|jgi:FMN-dependent NADH-azoreductase|nr:NAD(P)H-dependent oxidoreductase [Anaerohalosphaeraceae bacterium]